MLSFFYVRNPSNVQHFQNTKYFQIKNEDKVVEPVLKEEVESTSVFPVKINRNNDNLDEEDADDTNLKNSQMLESDQTSIISKIKIEASQISNNNITENAQQSEAMMRKLKDKPVKCCHCDYVAETPYILYYHKRRNHFTEDDYVKCQFCSYKHFLKSKIFQHIKCRHKQLIKTLKAEGSRELETSTINEEPSTSNKEEKVKFSNDDSISLEQKPSTSNSIEQAEEDDSSDDEFIKVLLNLKKRRQENTSLRQCDKCGKIYNNYKSLFIHKKTHMSDEEKFACTHCGKKFTRKYLLRKHIERFHVLIPTVMCPNCPFATISEKQLEIHFKLCHTERPFKCDKCPKKFKTKKTLKQHSHTHIELTLKCDICSKSFGIEKQLKQHKRRHNMEGQPCEYCGKLIKYMQKHQETCLAKINKD